MGLEPTTPCLQSWPVLRVSIGESAKVLVTAFVPCRQMPSVTFRDRSLGHGAKGPPSRSVARAVTTDAGLKREGTGSTPVRPTTGAAESPNECPDPRGRVVVLSVADGVPDLTCSTRCVARPYGSGAAMVALMSRVEAVGLGDELYKSQPLGDDVWRL
jgi:hypothetical protein